MPLEALALRCGHRGGTVPPTAPTCSPPPDTAYTATPQPRTGTQPQVHRHRHTHTQVQQRTCAACQPPGSMQGTCNHGTNRERGKVHEQTEQLRPHFLHHTQRQQRVQADPTTRKVSTLRCHLRTTASPWRRVDAQEGRGATRCIRCHQHAHRYVAQPSSLGSLRQQRSQRFQASAGVSITDAGESVGGVAVATCGSVLILATPAHTRWRQQL